LLLRSNDLPDSQISDGSHEGTQYLFTSSPASDIEIVEEWSNAFSVGLLLFELAVNVKFYIFASSGINDSDVIPSELFEFIGEPLV
jgi:hypothetical protein